MQQSQRTRIRWLSYVGTFSLVAALAVYGCSSGDGGNGGSGDPAGGLVDEEGNDISNVNVTDAVNVQVSGLEANTQYAYDVTGPNGEQLSPEGGFIFVTDEDGEADGAFVQNLDNVVDNGSALTIDGLNQQERAVTAGEYLITIMDKEGNVILEITFTVEDAPRVFCADGSGTARASFSPSEAVHAALDQGAGSIADGSYTCYVISDRPLEEGEELVGINSGTVNVSNGEGSASLGVFPALGGYDVVCDMDDDGVYTPGVDLMSRPSIYQVCFTTQTPNSGNHIIGQVCADRRGNYRDVFDPNADDSNIRDVYAYITPAERSTVTHTIGVYKFVVPHQTAWEDGDALNDVTGVDGAEAYEVDSVQAFCTNEHPWRIWPRELLVAGCYDCVIDVNHNGVYDQGTDFVDNIDNRGEPICGMRVASTACADFVNVTSHDDGDSVNATAVALTGTFTAAPLGGMVIVSQGVQSSYTEIQGGGTDFSANVPLFFGTNLITVAALRDEDTVCSTTFSLESTASTARDRLFQVQLNWDGDTDMDLHLVRPNGAYANGGGGGDDCNYDGCDVGLDGLGTNPIDWGSAGEDDDPRLDLDCIACGNGKENIWMNQISEDGEYKIYVDAYSGTEDPVSVSVFIRGQNKGTVNCGAMSSGTETDSCFVGTIRWQGGSSGDGVFIPSGTKAQDF